MEGLLRDGIAAESNGETYPKQISSFPRKSDFQVNIFRERLGIPSGQPVRRHHLERYGRTDVTVSLISEGVYKFDFSSLAERLFFKLWAHPWMCHQ